MEETVWERLNRPPARYRTVPLWSWNDKLEAAELTRQIEEMHAAGIGGFFMHARGGLKTLYMSDAWMEAIGLCIEKARELGMEPWLYDENGWPSGFGDGKVPALGPAYQQKRLAYEFAPFRNGTAQTIAYYEITEQGYKLSSGDDADQRSDLRVYYEVNPFYIDTLSKMAVGAFIDEVYEAYWTRFGESFGSAIKGVFTDEPQFARRELPWSFELEAAFEERCGYRLRAALPALFFQTDGSRKARYDYWRCVTAMFTEAYAKQIGEWCGRRGWSATGHVVDEQTLMNQVSSVGDPLAFYEYLQIPGCDWLGRFVGEDPIVPKQVGSAARQLGKKLAITESFGCSGWNVSLRDLKRIGEWQFVHGINLMCQHLQSYSLKGLRKRDYPPSLFYQQPWWEDYRLFNDYFARLTMLLSEGVRQAEVLLLHPIRTAWVEQTGRDASGIRPYHDAFAQLTRWLCQSLIEHDYGSESLIERHGDVRDGRFIVGQAAYRVVIVPPGVAIGEMTFELLQRFVSQGGCLIAFSPYPLWVGGVYDAASERLFAAAVQPGWSREALAARVAEAAPPFVALADGSGSPIASDEINVQTLELDGAMIYYVVNSGDRDFGEIDFYFNRKGSVSRIDLESGEIVPLIWTETEDGARIRLKLYPAQSYVLQLVPGASEPPLKFPDVADVRSVALPLDRAWRLVASDLNSLTLDTCRIRIADGDWSERRPIILIQDQLLRMRRTVPIALEFEFYATPDVAGDREFYLAMEDPASSVIRVNGQPVESTECGWWMDTSFKKVDIRGQICQGRNTILLETEFRLSPSTLEALERAERFESEGNKLTLDTELESVYLLGAFAVSSEAPFTDGERRAVFNEGPFKIAALPDLVMADDLVRQGFPFFAGNARLEQTVRIDQAGWSSASWQFPSAPDAIVSRLWINGREVRAFVWEPYEADITDYLRMGDNRIELELTSSCRNTLGPHHHLKGEVYKVGPDSFKDKPGWTDRDIEPGTNIYLDRYAFVRFGLSEAPRIVLRGGSNEA
ncbi:hypothetical protein SAMN05216312_10415 [Cohnella sp. OV330]|uniref:glycosyl hydrolase n=1 Tax=Cohnella sp. OV330 TaxID=1855288 RepID=UPI0008E35DFC|nr:glycosyl hydrolase [Cohnella sp. OV330]SFB14183.1 hypothetical protein SAMN05216312_10415 [Cohnella sp. OV330]